MSVTVPAKPSLRALSTARRPAREAPTTTSRRGVIGSVLDQPEGLGGAAGDGRLDLGQSPVGHDLGPEHESAVVVHFEDRGGEGLADAEPGALPRSSRILIWIASW